MKPLGVSLDIKGGEVSGEVLAASDRIAAFLGVPVERLYGASYRHFLETPPERIDWDDYVALKEITAQVAGSDERLLGVGNKIIQTRQTAAGARALALFVDPGLMILKASKNGWGRLYTNIDVECSREEDRIRVEVRLHDGFAPSRPFFVQNAGILEHAPCLIGCGPAEVEWSTDGYSGVYLVRPPPSTTIWSRIKRSISVLFNTGATIQELVDQQIRLNRQNRELQAALKKAQIALATRDRFLQTIDHELRTPLNGIRGAVRALQAQAETSERSAEDATWIAVIDRSETMLGDTIGSILAYTKLEAETVVARPREFRVRALAETLKNDALHRAEGIAIELECAVERDRWVRGDDEQFERIARELLHNAVRFGGGQPIKISVALGAENELCIRVTDRGLGISEDNLDRIFEPFVQIHCGEARAFGGSGLGLTIAGALTKAMGGRLRVESKVGEGSTFIAELPIEACTREVELAPSETKVLLVDDNHVNVMIASRLLNKLGCQVSIAEDGLRALELYDRETVDLVLMDCEMPNLDGWAATRKLRLERGATTPIVALTAYTAEADRQRCFDAGMNDFLSKPVSEAALEAMLDRWIRVTRSRAAPSLESPAPRRAVSARR